MPGSLVQVGAQVLCSHSGQATPSVPNQRVTLDGAPSVLINSQYMIAGCTLPPPSAGNGPCVSGQWLSGTTRVLSNNQPLVMQSGNSVCSPTGTTMQVVSAQTRVTAI